MCGRFTITVTIEELMLFYNIEDEPQGFHLPRFNIAPTQIIPAIIHDGEKNRLGPLRWGLVPAWAKDDKFGANLINARAETLTEKPAFKSLVSRKRCIVPADGFYEWKKVSGGKQPMRITLTSRKLFALAGLYDTWISPEGKKLHTCTIITTKPNELVADIHDRMPVILEPEAERQWLDRSETDHERLLALLKPYPAEQMQAYPVAKEVGNVRNDYEQLTVEIKPEEQKQIEIDSLF